MKLSLEKRTNLLRLKVSLKAKLNKITQVLRLSDYFVII